MPRWDEKIELNKIIQIADDEYDLSRHEEPCPKEAATMIAGELRKSKYLAHFAPMIVAAKSIAEVNRILDRVFDDADRWRVWCGF